MATGCVDPAKRRIVCSTFSSRAGSDRHLYSSTHSTEKGGLQGAEESETGEANSTEVEKTNFVTIGGAWAEREEDLQKPSTRPLALVVDHESIVVGCQDGTVYRLGFIGSKYQDKPPPAIGGEADEESRKKLEGADAVIEDLTELREVWKDLMLPPEAPPDHPGRIKVDVLKAVGLK
jgi:pyrimidine and pyridine-specific 5'-nucleotidase